jgi:two-component system response regulator RegA
MSDPKTLLIVEDDPSFSRTLHRSFERRGYTVASAARHDEVVEVLRHFAPLFAVVDLKLEGASGLASVRAIRESAPSARIVVLTGFASISTAIEAIKLGASYYLAKPSNTDEIENAFEHEAGTLIAPVGQRASSIKAVEWEHIHRTLAETDYNISETARRLGMHRRTLARKLGKRPLK